MNMLLDKTIILIIRKFAFSTVKNNICNSFEVGRIDSGGEGSNSLPNLTDEKKSFFKATIQVHNVSYGLIQAIHTI